MFIQAAKRTLALLVAFVLIFPLLLLQCFAATTATVSHDIPNLDITYTYQDGTTTATPSGTTVSFTITSAIKRNDTTITLCNSSDVRQTLSFSYTVTGGIHSNGFGSTSGNISKILEPNGEDGCELEYIVIANAIRGSVTVTLSGITMEPVTAANFNIGVECDASLGSVTSSITATTTDNGIDVPVTPGSSLTLTASPKAGAAFLAWVNPADNSIISTSAAYTFTPLGDTSLKAVFCSSSTAWFMAGRTAGQQYLYDDLTTAANKAATLTDKTVVLMNNGTLTGSHTIPTGVTLLIPRDSAYTIDATTPGDDGANSYTNPTAFRTMTMTEGASISVNGAISIGGKAGTHLSGSDSIASSFWHNNGAPSGSLGWINMVSGSSITVNSGGNLYAWGYITGAGTVTVKDKGAVYEDLQIRDYRGGEYTSKMVGNTYKVFPFSQYYVQNIEVPLTLEAGAVEYVCMSLSYRPLVTSYVAKENGIFVGKDSGLIRLSYGSLTRRYDGSTDRMIYELNGTISLDNLAISIKLTDNKNVNIDSANYVAPINGNMTMNINTGSTVSVNQDFALLPGSIINIAEEATVTMASEKKLIVYDTNIQWTSTNGTAVEPEAWTKGYCRYNNVKYESVLYAPGRTNTASRSWVDAKVVVNGTLDATNGSIYTTAYGTDNANICSTGNGKIIIGVSGKSTETYVYYQDNTASLDFDHAYIGLSISPAQLKNSDDTFVTTATDPATYNYIDGYWVAADCGRLDIVATNIAVNDGLDVRFYVDMADMDAGTIYTAVITKSFADNRTPVTKVVTSESWAPQPISDTVTYKYFTFEDVSAKEMMDNIEVKIYTDYVDAANPGVQVSNTFVETIQNYAIRTLAPILTAIEKKTATDEDRLLASALADMLQYGAAAQVHFKYNTEQLATEEPESLAEKYQGVLAKGWGYATESPVAMASNRTNGDNFKGVTVSATNTLMFTFYFGIENPEGMYAKITYTDSSNTVHVQQEVQGSDFYARDPGSLYGVDVTKLSIVDGRLLLTCTVYNADGTTYGSATDSIEGYAARKSDSTDEAIDIFERIMMFVDSAGAYFEQVSQSSGG